jgi:hypothetical protein
MKSFRHILLSGAAIIIVASLSFFQNCAEPNDYGSMDLAKTGAPDNSQLLIPGSDQLPGTTAADPNVKRTAADYIRVLYSGLLERPPTANETSSWEYYLSHGYGCTYAAQGVMGTSEYTALHAALTASKAVTDLYLGLLGRSPTATELGSAGADAATQILASPGFQTYCSHFENLTL